METTPPLWHCLGRAWAGPGQVESRCGAAGAAFGGMVHFEKLVGQWERWPWKKPLRVWEDLGEDVITFLGKISGLSENIGRNSFQGDFIQTEWGSNHNYGSGGCLGMLTDAHLWHPFVHKKTRLGGAGRE